MEDDDVEDARESTTVRVGDSELVQLLEAQGLVSGAGLFRFLCAVFVNVGDVHSCHVKHASLPSSL